MIVQKIYEFRFFILLIILPGGAFLWQPFQKALIVNNSLRIWFKEDSPTLRHYDDFQDRFGSDEVIVILFNDERGVLQPANIDRLKKLTARLENHPDVASVFSISNVKMLQQKGISLLSSELLDARLSEEALRNRLSSMPLLSQHLVNEDLTATRLIVQLKRLPDIDARRGEIIRSIKASAYQEIAENQLAFGGVGVIFEGLNELTQQDFGRFLGLAYLVMFVVLLSLYRQFLVLVFAVGVIVLATYFTIGLYGLAGHELNLMSTLIPIILVLLGLMDVIHIMNARMHQQHPASSTHEQAMAALQKVWKPCLFTTLTTMAGFLSLVFTPLSILRNFGLFSALGIGFCLLFTYLLGVFIVPRVATTSSFPFSTVRLWDYLTRHQKVLRIITLIVGVGSLVGMLLIKVDTYTLGYLPSDHPVVQDHMLITRKWGNYMPLELMLETQGDQPVYSPEILQRSLLLIDTLTNMDGISGGFGFSSLMQAGLQARYGNKATEALRSTSAVMRTQRTLKQYYPEVYARTVDATGRYARITLFGKMSSAAELSRRLDTLMAQSEHTLGAIARVTPSGYLPMYADIVTYATQSQVQSLGLAIVFIFVLVAAFIRSLRLAFIAVLTNVFPVVVLFGTIGWLGIDLDIATASIAAIGLSFCIDDSIHVMYEYQKNRAAGFTATAAQENTFHRIGPALITSSLVLFCGYLLMAFASLKTVYLFGSLTALMVLAALYAQLVLFPWLIRQLT